MTHPTITTPNGLTGFWSNPINQEPKIGDRVLVTINQLGTGTITGFFKEGEFIGVIVKPDHNQRPDWHVAQFKRSGAEFKGYMVFGAEIKFL